MYAETLHNLLCFSHDDYLKPDGARYHIAMGLPSPEDRAQLWAGVTDGDHSPWEGWNVTAWPVATIVRGKTIVSDGQLHVGADYGQWQPRRIEPEVLQRPVVV